jgi:cytoskeletal protein CcmA (bactofilin family)
MLGNSRKTTAANPPPPAADRGRPLVKSSGVPSIISAEMTIHGNLQSTGDLQIEGSVQGEIAVAKLVIAEGGAVTGNIVARDVRICGAVTGTVRAATIALTATARVVGDLFHEIFSIEAGGQFEGKSSRLAANNEPALPAPTPAAPAAEPLWLAADQPAAAYADGN